MSEQQVWCQKRIDELHVCDHYLDRLRENLLELNDIKKSIEDNMTRLQKALSACKLELCNQCVKDFEEINLKRVGGEQKEAKKKSD